MVVWEKCIMFKLFWHKELVFSFLDITVRKKYFKSFYVLFQIEKIRWKFARRQKESFLPIGRADGFIAKISSR